MRSAFVETPDELHQVGRMLERIAGFVVSAFARRIAAERENVSDARLGVTPQDRFDLRLAVADARQVRNRIELGRVLNRSTRSWRQVARPTASAVSHADEMRHVFFQLPESSGQGSLAAEIFRTKTKEKPPDSLLLSVKNVRPKGLVCSVPWTKALL